MASLESLQQEFLFLSGKARGISLAGHEISSRLHRIHKAEKKAKKWEKKYGASPFSAVREVLSGGAGILEFPLPDDSMTCSKGYLEGLYRLFFSQEMEVDAKIREIRLEIERLGGVVPNRYFS